MPDWRVLLGAIQAELGLKVVHHLKAIVLAVTIDVGGDHLATHVPVASLEREATIRDTISASHKLRNLEGLDWISS